VGDHPAAALFLRHRRDLVVGAAQLERAGRLQALGLEVEVVILLAARAWNQWRVKRNAAYPTLRKPYVFQGDHERSKLLAVRTVSSAPER
jgi:hypothetical protein